MTTSIPSPATIRSIFLLFAKGDHAGFWSHVSPDVQWTIMGTHPCAGTYNSAQEFQTKVLGRVVPFLDDVEMCIGLCIAGAGVESDHIETTVVVQGEGGYWSVTELGIKGKCKNGFIYDNKYAWICRWKDGKIVQVREYLDSAMVKQAMEENGA